MDGRRGEEDVPRSLADPLENNDGAAVIEHCGFKF